MASVFDNNTFVGTLTADDLEIDSGTLSIDAANNRVGMGLSAPKTRLTVEGAVTLKEQSNADADTAAYGQIWCKTATPNQLWFTDDAGTDTQLGAGGGAADNANTILHMSTFA